ncbi:hypothetical protein AB0C12_43040 [Actinoplanes sp. NPDC048967]|uniref:hypothetical protein n=1 Tax=Actinoplanes sp. NPDC048967 TaxID=3155269 RepID=UPI0033CB4709
MTAPPDHGGLHPYVASAPLPTLETTGLTSVISAVRFVWHGASCSWCRRTVALWSDGGTIEVGLRIIPATRRRPIRPRWFQIFRPAAAPLVPTVCPYPSCSSAAITDAQADAGRWLDGRWALTTGPFTLGPETPNHCPYPAHPHTYRLLDQVYVELRAAHPDLAAAADVAERERRKRAARRR